MSTAFVMVGAPASGKSTYARRIAEREKAVIISGDDIRAELYGDATIEGCWVDIWDAIVESVADACPRPVILDGTHYRKDYRAEAITLLRSYGYDRIEAIVMDVPLKRCLERNSQRSRQVPDHVIEKMHVDLNDSLKDVTLEDFNIIHYIY